MSNAELGEIRLSRARQLDCFYQNDLGESTASCIGAEQALLTKIDDAIILVEDRQQEDYSVSQLNYQG
jgi:hypothetical protein